jgi:hypothetical protein
VTPQHLHSRGNPLPVTAYAGAQVAAVRESSKISAIIPIVGLPAGRSPPEKNRYFQKSAVRVKAAIAGKLHAVFAAELVDPSGCINDFLGAGIKRVTGRTHVDMKLVG